MAILSLALGIGLNVAVFTVIDAILLRPLPVTDPARLVDIYTSGTSLARAASAGTSLSSTDTFQTNSLPDLRDLADGATTLSGVVGYSPMFAAVNAGNRTDIVLGEIVTGNYFDVLGVRASAGRTLEPADDVPGAPGTVAVSAAYARTHGNGPDIVGRHISIRGKPFTVVGVLASSFEGMFPALMPSVWLTTSHVADIDSAGISESIPSPTGTSPLDRRGDRWLFAKARLKPGVSFAEAKANLEAVAARIRDANPQTNRNRRVTVLPSVATRVHPEGDRFFKVVLAFAILGVGLLLAVTAANIVGMVLARNASRQRNVAIQMAVGASRSRVVRQVLAENAVLCTCGSLAGVVLAVWLAHGLSALPLPLPLPLPVHIALDFRLDRRVLIFAIAASLGTGLLIGLFPALAGAHTTVDAVLKSSIRIGAPHARWRTRDALVLGQVAVATVLLLVACLFLRSVATARDAKVGFDPGGLALLSADPSEVGDTAVESQDFWRRVAEAVRSLPGVRGVAFASRFPFSISFSRMNVAVPGRQRSADELGRAVMNATVSPGYFDTLGVPLIAGRDFRASDTPNRPTVVIVNETMARQSWPNGTAVGQRVFDRTLSSGRSFEVIGVVANHKLQTVGESEQAAIYFVDTDAPVGFGNLGVRTDGDAGTLLRAMRRIVVATDPRVPVIQLATMREQIATTLLPARLAAALSGVLGVVAIFLASLGLYGVMASLVTQRVPEIGVRIALGADRASILSLVMRRGLRLAAIGLGLGSLMAAGLARVLAHTGALYGITGADPIAWVSSALVVVVVTGAANLLPALRAVRIDPVRAINTE